jgi:hypothetical protein
MNQFNGVCERLGVPIANEKTEGPTTILEYLQEIEHPIGRHLSM